MEILLPIEDLQSSRTYRFYMQTLSREERQYDPVGLNKSLKDIYMYMNKWGKLDF